MPSSNKFDFSNSIGDILGGLTAAIIALPLALAFGIASGAGPLAGIYSAIIVGFFAALFGGTCTQISGPTGPMTVVMTIVISQFTATYPEQGIYYAFITVMFSGFIQILFGLFKLGKYIVLVPYPVVSGFMTGIGIIIIVLQVAPLLGFAPSANVLDSILLLPEQIENLNLFELILGMSSLAILFLWRGSLNKKFPSAILVLIVGTLAVQIFNLNQNVEIVGPIKSGLPSVIQLSIDPDVIFDVVYFGLILAVLGAIDSLLTSLVADNITGQQHNSEQELIGQGIGNAVAGLFSALPGAGATMRTVVNIKAGGTTALSGVLHSLILLAAALGFGFIFESIPLAVLSAILIKVGFDIIDWPFLLRIKTLPIFSIALMALVAILTVFVDLITAVFVGVFIKNIVVIQKLSHLELGQIVVATGRENEKPALIKQSEFDLLTTYNGNIAIIRIIGPITYAVTRGLEKQFSTMGKPTTLILEFSSDSVIGISTALSLEKEIKKWQQQNIQVKLIDTQPNNRSEIHQLGIQQLVGEENCFVSFETLKETIDLFQINKMQY